MGMAALVAEAC
jgi:hypothetical protein